MCLCISIRYSFKALNCTFLWKQSQILFRSVKITFIHIIQIRENVLAQISTAESTAQIAH